MYKIFNEGIAMKNKVIIGVIVQIVSIKCSLIINRFVILLIIKKINMYEINVVIIISINIV